ncbi:MAG TPA: FimV/HubP family polar landmark protein [Thiopseudomonas sp.]|nr:FimV/HubP family polar landmark protein [Thiopseudomonas sp.]
MLQVRKLVLAVAAATAFSSSFTYALGLGDLSIQSSANQPLEAEISLLDVRDLSAADIKPQLAPAEAFKQAGIKRELYLTSLVFTPVLSANGKNVIRVSSSNPVSASSLSFLVEVLWPNGRLLREFTVPVDAPLYKSESLASTTQQPATTAAKPSTSMRAADYRVQRNDTLWEIALQNRGSASVQQTMLALQDLNPDAFLDNNINRLKNNKVLRLPTAQEINRRSHAAAIAQVAEQNASWKAGRAASAQAKRQLDATRRKAAAAAPSQVEQTDSLRLVSDAPGQATKAADQGSTAELRAVQDQLAASNERLDSALLENADLTSQIQDLDSQLDKLKRLLELKDNQLSQLQDALGIVPQADIVGEGVDALEAELNLQDAPAIDLDSAFDISNVIDPLQIDAVTDESLLAADKAAAEEQSVVEQFISNPMLLSAAGGIAVLALLLLSLAIARSNARKQAALYDEQLTNNLTPITPNYRGQSGKTAAQHTDAFADELIFEKPTVNPAFKPSRTAPAVDVGLTAETVDELDAELDDLSALLADAEPLSDPTPADNEIDAFGFDLEAPIESDTSKPADEFSFDDLELDLAASSSPKAIDDFDFSAQLDQASNELDEPTASMPQATDLSEFNLDDIDDLTQDIPLADVPSPATDDKDDLDFLSDANSDADEVATKLNLALAYIDMDDSQGARDILSEVLAEGTAAQQAEARELINQLG